MANDFRMANEEDIRFRESCQWGWGKYGGSLKKDKKFDDLFWWRVRPSNRQFSAFYSRKLT
jgi:hypothetical protein